MNGHALTVLEFARLLDEVASRACSGPGAVRVRALRPSRDADWIDCEHARVGAVRVLRSGESPLRAEPVPDLGPALDRLRVPGAMWSAEPLRDCARLLQASRRTALALADDERPRDALTVLAPLREGLFHHKELAVALERAIADDATVKDDASPALRRLRRELRAAEGEVVKLLERQLARLDDAMRVPDMSVTVRNGRYVIPIRREARTTVGGIVHDASATGATLFVEPPAAVEHSNRLRELEAQERDEVDRVLRELTDLTRPHRDALLVTLEALAEIDSLHARASFADTYDCVAPGFGPASQGWTIARGRHPLLLIGGVDAVPFDLDMTGTERTLVVSGPNTGGKTVLLKAVGLLAAMAQAGVPPSTGPGTRLAVFDDYFADIGDEQSIEASLSTFSAHLRNLAEILASATAASLVLIDELGSGTDPLEGAALGGAILESLTRRGACTLSTTHLGALKELATQVPGVVNGSLQFDAEQLAPTYRFLKGIPGRSYGISIARRLGFPADVVERAEERVPRVERDVAALLERLEAQQGALTAREEELAQLTDDAHARAQRVSARERELREKERELERESRQEARKYLLYARAEIDRTMRDLKRAPVSDVDRAARAPRQQAEQLASRHADALDALAIEDKTARLRAVGRNERTATPPGAGDLVAVESVGGMPGRVLEVRGNEALVAVGSLKMMLPLHSLAKRPRDEPVAPVPLRGDVPEAEPRGEVDLRGLRIDEMEAHLFRALDDAIRADLPTLRIIHGKGTGALRDRVTEMLRKDTRVRQFRLGERNEGGTGVTMADLR